jgi:putative FmdB family regulatory protein
MPTYGYECTKCGHEFDQFQSILDEPLKRCPKCRGKVERLIGSGGAVIFKGSGFYHTDYKTKSERCAEAGCGNLKSCPNREASCEKKICEA